MRSPQTEWNPVIGDINFYIDINKVVTSDRSKMFGIKSRKCRFDTELTSDRSYPLGLYTQNLCLMECSVDTAINLCGCRPFFYKIGPGPICNISGMICLSRNRWNETRSNCTCLPQCNSVDYIFTRTSTIDSPLESNMITANLRIPKTRLKRDIKFGIHYLVVSIGGAAALFLGCSFISIAELIYFATERLFHKPCCERKLCASKWLRFRISNQNRDSTSPTRCMIIFTKFTQQLYYFVNNSSLHGIRYLDRRYGMIDRIYWMCVLAASVIAMILVFVYTLNDYLNEPVVINFDPIITKKSSVFPVVSVCIRRSDYVKPSTKRIKQYVKRYYTEHDIEEPQR
ncbi:uncharacterized protein LOC129564958 [Sitodiplosis mosellana]|uniref:uncharacterized protein LOC129564958 n=1 Tax=Sitodiplosis mosellana TaxID=263140 RepID=UPI002443EECC|nr:uncharacterized protein LOC129564958 [Sitodiplosis mosellana]